MLRRFRSPRLAGLTLAAFLIAQPVVGCALVCLVDNHHSLHEMVGMNQPAATGDAVCHTSIGAATRHGPAQTLSFMEPAGVSAPARPGTRSVATPVVRPAVVPQFSPSVDPPPPRLV